MEDGKAALINEEGDVTLIPAAGSLVAGEMLGNNLDVRTRIIVLGGAVGDGVLTGLLGCGKNLNDLCLVIRNGTCLFCQPHLWRKFRAVGGSIKVVDPIRLVAVTLNPISPHGMNFPHRDFFAAATQFLSPYPVMDVVRGYCAPGNGASL
jgi:hypothetical protein